MSGYLRFDKTGSDEIDAILAAIEAARCRYHSTMDWTGPDGDGLSERDRIQIAAGEAAETIARLTAARVHIGRDLMQIRELAADLERQLKTADTERLKLTIGGELVGLRYAEQLLGVTLARLQPEEGGGG